MTEAQALIHSLNKDRLFATQTDRERERICAKIESDVMGRMLEDIVLCETIRAVPYKLAYAERNYGKILSRAVMYRGKSFVRKKGVSYLNVAAFLKDMGDGVSRSQAGSF